ncbi:MAG: hypothetical protein HUJ66_08640 [Oscillospiraceae bacterium]|nr:hypothetical protein [Oscillospiraceae bacterium]
MRNRKIGIILVLFIIILAVVGILVTRAFNSGNGSGDAPDWDGKGGKGNAAETETVQPTETPPPEPTPTFTVAPEGYFEDALIIGDSRTEGIRMCADIPGVTYFCSVGMGVTGAFYEAVSVANYGTVTLDSLLGMKQFGKIYIMLGINDIGGDVDTLAQRFGTLLERIRAAQPDALIIIEANLRVTSSYNSTYVTNERIDRFNELISHYADNVTVFYLDVNPLFDDGTGRGLNPSISPDGLHVPGAQYVEWGNWIMNHAVVFQ